MADKQTTKELQELSEACFGNKHAWRKLTKRGVMILTQNGEHTYRKAVPLTELQVKDFMVKKLEERAKKEQQDAKDSE